MAKVVETNVGKPEEVLDQKLAHVLSSKCRISTVRRSSSSDSAGSRIKRRKDKKSSRRSRSRSRDRSRDRYGRTRRSRSKSTFVYHSSKSKSYQSDSRDRHRDRHHRSRSKSRDRYRSCRSRSKSYIREFVSKPNKRSSSSSSSDSSEPSKPVKSKTSKSTNKAGSVIKGGPAKNEKSSPDCVIVDGTVLEEINEDKFIPKQFTSNKAKKVPENIVIDLQKNTIKVPEVEQLEPDGIFHHSLFLNEEARMEKWVKELFSFRQKALQQGVRNNR